jgi:hypothetical protein
MKVSILKYYYLLLFILLSISCSKGKFEETNESIILSKPINEAPCEGFKFEDELEVNFEWTLKGDYTSLTLQINELDEFKKIIGPDNQIIVTVDGSKLQEPVKVKYGKWYQWKVFRENPKLESETFTFFSEGEPFINNAPYPVAIKIVQNSSGIVQFTWLEPKDDGDGINERMVYSASFGTTVEAVTTIESNMNAPKTLTLEPVTINEEYYIKVIAQEYDTDNNPGNSSVSLIKIKVEN